MMSNTKVQIDPEVFNKVYLPHLENNTRVQTFYGGASSGKSVFLAQRAVYDVLQGGRNYLVCRYSAKWIRGSVYNEINKIITAWGIEDLFKVNKSDFTITCNNGYQIIFTGLDSDQKIKSITPVKGVITDIWVEEATEVPERTITQLRKRLRGKTPGGLKKRITISFNPILKSHYLYKTYFAGVGWKDDQAEYDDGKISILKTTYKDNKFLEQDDIDDLENETDKYTYEVYTLGNWGVLGHAIFTNIKVKDLTEKIGTFDRIRNGLDFGFANDPVAAVRIHYDRKKKEVYIFDEYVELGVTNDVLAKELEPMIGGEYITCDSAEPKSIAELKLHGINAQPAKKGPGSVNFGIQWLQQQTIFIHHTLVKSIANFETYHWKENRQGEIMRVPADGNDDTIDATRYALEGDAEQTRAEFVEVKGL